MDLHSKKKSSKPKDGSLCHSKFQKWKSAMILVTLEMRLRSNLWYMMPSFCIFHLVYEYQVCTLNGYWFTGMCLSQLVIMGKLNFDPWNLEIRSQWPNFGYALQGSLKLCTVDMSNMAQLGPLVSISVCVYHANRWTDSGCHFIWCALLTYYTAKLK